jgi:hypothetical protein
MGAAATAMVGKHDEGSEDGEDDSFDFYTQRKANKRGARAIAGARQRLRRFAQNGMVGTERADYTDVTAKHVVLCGKDGAAPSANTIWAHRQQMRIVGDIVHTELWFTSPLDGYLSTTSSERTNPLSWGGWLGTFIGRSAENDDAGVTLFPRTYETEDYQYFRIHVSALEIDRMLSFVGEQLPKSFNKHGLRRAWLPRALNRTTTGNTWFCSELIFATLRASRMFDRMENLDDDFYFSNPGSVTPSYLLDELLNSRNMSVCHNVFYGLGDVAGDLYPQHEARNVRALDYTPILDDSESTFDV